MILAEGPETVAAFIGKPILATGRIVLPVGYCGREPVEAIRKLYTKTHNYVDNLASWVSLRASRSR
jgi:hypothetical protein